MESGVAYTSLAPAGEDRFQRLRQELGLTTFGLNLIRLGPGQRGRIHRHLRQEEVYLVLEGTLSLAVEGEEIDLAAGELVRVPADVRRRLANRGPGRLVLLALGGEGEHAGRDGEAFTDWASTEGAPPQEVPLPADLGEDERRR
jgi:mannose-6-phosphate isomerase-like protein (cupin superfamily)